jgi:hypothetical protein
MKADKIVQFLGAVGVTNANKSKRAGWVISRCPLGPWKHTDGVSGPEVFGVRIEPNDPHANCFACGWHGTLGSLLQRMVGENKVTPKIEAKWGQALQLVADAEAEFEVDFDTPGIEELLAMNKGLHEFPEWWLETFPPVASSSIALKYLHGRKVLDHMSEWCELRWDPNEKRICFPVRDFKHRLVGLHGRAIDEATEPRYRMYTYAKQNNPIAWLGEDWVDLERPIVVAEGPFDLVSVARVYGNVVSPLFANPSNEKLERMADAHEWVTFLDRGVGGDKGRERIDKALGASHVIRHVLPPKGRKDPGEMTVPELVASLHDFVQLNVAT